MKTLAIALCILLVVLPASGQQITGARAPSFYVAYGVRDVPVEPLDEWSTSQVEFQSAGYQVPAAPPYPQRYPVRRGGGYPRFGPQFGYWGPQMSSRGDVIAYVVVMGVLAAALIRGDR